MEQVFPQRFLLISNELLIFILSAFLYSSSLGRNGKIKFSLLWKFNVTRHTSTFCLYEPFHRLWCETGCQQATLFFRWSPFIFPRLLLHKSTDARCCMKDLKMMSVLLVRYLFLIIFAVTVLKIPENSLHFSIMVHVSRPCWSCFNDNECYRPALKCWKTLMQCN